MILWTDNDISTASNMLIAGSTYADIATVIGKTSKAVRLKLNKLGLFYNQYHRKEDCFCMQCGVLLVGWQRKFCSHSCNALYNNALRVMNNVCLFCGKRGISKKRKFCSRTCFNQYTLQTKFSQLEKGFYGSSANGIDHSRLIKKYLIYKNGNKCMKCGWSEVNPVSGMVPIELEHIDGNSENNNLNNVLLLCPNCHSLTPTFRSLNKGNGRHKRRERYRNGQSF
jgi:hypothetical protein